MTENKPTPFDPDRYVGTITVVTPNSVKANFPKAVSTPDNRNAIKGNVGDFVFIECDEYAVFGRITEITLPDRERLSIEPSVGKEIQAHPIGTIQLLATMEVANNKIMRGVSTYPRIGDRIFIAHPKLITKMTEDDSISKVMTIGLGSVTVSKESNVSIAPEALFGRHCGVLGATGGGKSWTLARLIEEIFNVRGKAILFDATGEFADLPFISTHVSMGKKDKDFETEVTFPYRLFLEKDLFALFTPSIQSQAPKLREAIKSLKLIEALNGKTVPSGLNLENGKNIKKAGELRGVYYNTLRAHEAKVNDPYCDFDIKNLARQIAYECVNPTPYGQEKSDNWGQENKTDLNYCASLILRIEQRISAPELACIFTETPPTLVEKIDAFLADPQASVLRVSMKNLSFQYNARELIANAIGRHLLSEARRDKFKEMPVVCMLDEAHQFLEKTVGTESSSIYLDAFGLIAKEGRKYGLTCVFATQRPRDIPEDVLSQLGTLIVHRLTNDRDRNIVERACGDIDKSAAAFLPMLDQGEALIVGTDFPIPVPLKIKAPSKGPNSMGPQYQTYWGQKEKESKTGT